MKHNETFKEISHRLDQIIGVPFAELGDYYRKPWTGDAAHNKGWSGQLVHRLITGRSGPEPEPDIVGLGLEVKSIPIGKGARVLEPTKIGALNYANLAVTEWPDSAPYHKLRSVLFVPIVKMNEKMPDEWYIRRPFLWLPSEKVLSELRSDYDSVRELVLARRFDDISSAKPPKGQGLALHAKPNAKNSRVRATYRIDGRDYDLKPKAWMLRQSFTQPIVRENLRVDLELSGTA